MNVLFIGNSYTYYYEMPQMFETLCRDNGKEVQVFSVTKGGRKLFENLNPEDEYCQRIAEITAAQSIDLCFLQENSTLPIENSALFQEGVSGLMEKLRSRVSKFTLYETWGRQNGSEFLAQYQLDNRSMTQRLSDAYRAVAEHCGAGVSKVGTAFYQVNAGDSGIDLYHWDLSHPSYAGSCLAALTHFYSVFGVLPANTDCIHLTEQELSVLKQAVLSVL